MTHATNSQSDDEIDVGMTDEETELDRLYRQALEAVESIEQSIESVWETAEAPSDAPDVIPLPASETAALPPANDVPQRSPAAALPPRATARQVLEACLFVGGKPLTSKALGQLLRDEFAQDVIEETLEALNRQYAEEGRPYEIRLAEGGWQLALRREFERVRHRVYGLGPKEVKLSQDALEILAVVAYHQPVSAEDVVALGKPSAGSVLRQLLRRELVAIERGEGGRNDVKYRTTRRFLELFNLEDLEDLPQAEAIAFK
jgi:segregation and condensation protein B